MGERAAAMRGAAPLREFHFAAKKVLCAFYNRPLERVLPLAFLGIALACTEGTILLRCSFPPCNGANFYDRSHKPSSPAPRLFIYHFSPPAYLSLCPSLLFSLYCVFISPWPVVSHSTTIMGNASFAFNLYNDAPTRFATTIILPKTTPPIPSA